MNKQKLLGKLNNRDLPGVGVVVYYRDGLKDYFFYEDFASDDLGIDRAARHFSDLINKGYVAKVEYIHKDHKTIHFWDWDTKSGNFTASSEFINFCRSYNFDYFYRLQRFIAVINGHEYKIDYTGAVDGISAMTAELAHKF